MSKDKEIKWMDIGKAILKNLAERVFKFVAFVAWVLLSMIEVAVREINAKLKRYLFPKRD